MVVAGAIVVYKHGKDKELYTVSKINLNEGTCELSSPTKSNKIASKESLREAEDTEIMIGYRMV